MSRVQGKIPNMVEPAARDNIEGDVATNDQGTWLWLTKFLHQDQYYGPRLLRLLNRKRISVNKRSHGGSNRNDDLRESIKRVISKEDPRTHQTLMRFIQKYGKLSNQTGRKQLCANTFFIVLIRIAQLYDTASGYMELYDDFCLAAYYHRYGFFVKGKQNKCQPMSLKVMIMRVYLFLSSFTIEDQDELLNSFYTHNVKDKKIARGFLQILGKFVQETHYEAEAIQFSLEGNLEKLGCKISKDSITKKVELEEQPRFIEDEQYVKRKVDSLAEFEAE